MKWGAVAVWNILATALLAAACSVCAQPVGKVYRIGVLSPTHSTEPASLQREPFEQGLREFGWTPGKNIIIEYRYAEEDVERLRTYAAEFVRMPVDLIVARSPLGVRAAQEATKSIPIVTAAASNPVQQGFVASLARPGGNITGLAVSVDDLGTKQLDYLRLVVPRIARVAILSDRKKMADMERAFLSTFEPTATTQKIAVRVFDIETAADIAPAFTAMAASHTDAVLVRPDPHVMEPNAVELVAQAARHRIPAMYPWRFYVESGGLMSYALAGGQPVFHHRSAFYVDRILKGARPGDLPVEQPMTYELVVNAKTAQSLGLTLPSLLLLQANEVIQ